jgi:hypothetical protein
LLQVLLSSGMVSDIFNGSVGVRGGI